MFRTVTHHGTAVSGSSLWRPGYVHAVALAESLKVGAEYGLNRRQLVRRRGINGEDEFVGGGRQVTCPAVRELDHAVGRCPLGTGSHVDGVVAQLFDI